MKQTKNFFFDIPQLAYFHIKSTSIFYTQLLLINMFKIMKLSVVCYAQNKSTHHSNFQSAFVHRIMDRTRKQFIRPTNTRTRHTVTVSIGRRVSEIIARSSKGIKSIKSCSIIGQFTTRHATRQSKITAE